MARVTVEDCVERVPNRFELVLLAAQRARNISRGEELTVERDNDKNPVCALRDIFGLQDISSEEEAAGMAQEELSPDDIEAAIEAELGGRRR